jgi:hypothetical protein
VDRRRAELQLRLVRGLLKQEIRRAPSDGQVGFAERSTVILDRVERAIDTESDPDLAEQLAAARAEVSELAQRA